MMNRSAVPGIYRCAFMIFVKSSFDHNLIYSVYSQINGEIFQIDLSIIDSPLNVFMILWIDAKLWLIQLLNCLEIASSRF